MRRQPTSGLLPSDPRRRRISNGGSRRSALSSLPLTALLSALAVVAVGCGSTTTSTPTAPPASTAASVATPTTTAPASTTTAAAGLSGTWKGQYGGAYQGTFTLAWQQSGSTLSGIIKLSSPASTLNIQGTLVNGNIRFGTVGSVAITYTGTVSGNSMSGSYQVNGSAGGSWSATKAS